MHPALTGVLLPGLALFVLTLVVFAGVTAYPFLGWDDMSSLAANPAFNPPTAASLKAYWTEIRPGEQFFVPITHTIWWTIAAVTGTDGGGGRAWRLEAGPFHVANWLAHGASAVLAFVVIRRLVRNTAAAWIGAALFALHPMQAEPVAWISSLYTPVSTAFALMAIWTLDLFLDLRYPFQPADGAADGEEPEQQHRRRRRGYSWWALAAGTLCLLAAMLTKPTAVVAPVLAGILEVSLRRRPWRQVVWPVVAWLLVLSIPVMLVATATQPRFTPYWPVWKRPFIAGDALAFYLWKIVLPVRLAADYGRSPEWLAANGAWRYTSVAAALAAAAVAAVAIRRRSVGTAGIAAGFVVALLPSLGLTPFDYQRYSTVADRYAYLAIFVVGVGAASLLTRPRSPRARKRAYVASACCLAVLAAGSIAQARLWRNDRTLFLHTLDVNPRSMAGRLALASDAERAGELSAAAEHLRVAREQYPDEPDVLRTSGDFSLRRGSFADAVTFYERALARGRATAPMLSNLGAALAQCGRHAEAADALERAVALNPKFRDAHLNLAIIQMGLGRPARAREHFEAALRIDPNSDLARQGLEQLRAAPP